MAPHDTSMDSPPSPRQKLASLRLEADQLQARLAAIAAEESALIAAVLSAVIEGLPSEMLAEIFVWYSRIADCGPPVLLALVCRRWRDVVFNTPMLWTRIDFGERGNTKTAIQNRLHRSGSTALDVRFAGIQEWPSAAADNENDGFEALVDQSHRWHSCVVDYREGNHHVFARSKPLALVSLEKLVINALEWNELYDLNPESSRRITAFRNAPILRNLTLWQLPKAQLDLPWTQITELELLGYWPKDMLTLLCATTRLAVLTYAPLSWVGTDNETRPDSSMIVLPHLHTLWLVADDETSLLPSLTLPSLRYIALQASEVGIARLQDLAERSGFRTNGTFRELNITTTLANLCLLLPHLQRSLEILRLSYLKCTSAQLDAFFREMKTDNGILPALTTLRLYSLSKTVDIRLGTVLQLLRARSGTDGAAALKVFTVEYDESRADAEEAAGVAWDAQYNLQAIEKLCVETGVRFAMTNAELPN
ncbi:F-box domain-containing protein [Mycena indigotica]|uniref:F-box domain-containing protein n=1 Tax=Mycena indigotica TaxID=2126181 RepID=A0A8H6W451_9AGAR|nr:F-box domain-containing protein [Mycena indigotica]KAF7298614.1 F-box domain-containing protein [Mycena indigotica]